MPTLSNYESEPLKIDENADYSYSKPEAAYRLRRDEVLGAFTKDFVSGHFNYDPTFRTIVESLIRGADPYSIIEHLIKDRKSLFEEIIRLNEEGIFPIKNK